MKISLAGQSYTLESVVAAAQQTINLYPETIQTGDEPRAQVLFGRPGLKLFATVTPPKVRCLWGSGGRCFIIHGGNESELHQDGSITTATQTVAQGTGSPDPAQIFSNGNQLMIVSGGLVYCDNGAGPVQVLQAMTGTASADGTSSEITWLTGPLFTPAMTGLTLRYDGNDYTVTGVVEIGASAGKVMLVDRPPPASAEGVWEVAAGPPLDGVSGGFLDGYFIVNRVPRPDLGGAEDLGRQFNISALYDGTSWNPLDYGVKEGYADYIRSILCDHEELWLFGRETTEIWTNVGITLDASGVASFPFQRVAGAFIHDGSVATYAPCSVGQYTCWLGGSPTGQTIAYRALAFQPERISTYNQEQAWNAPDFTVSDAVSYAYRDGGHLFWVINFWAEQQTWVYDMTEGLWHERYSFNSGTQLFTQYEPWFHCFIAEWGAGGMHLVADPNTGNIYEQSLDYYSDNGNAIQYLRAFPHLLNEDKYLFHHRFELYLETGAGTATDPPLTVGLDWSDDRGHTFANARTLQTAGTSGQYTNRIVWRRLGSSRDRVYRVGVQGTTKVALTDAFLEATPGIS